MNQSAPVGLDGGHGCPRGLSVERFSRLYGAAVRAETSAIEGRATLGLEAPANGAY